MTTEWQRRPDLADFEVIALPSIEERITNYEYFDELSIPRINPDNIADGGELFDRKLKIYKYGDQDWRITVPEIAQSQVGDEFKTWEEAFEYLYELLEQKEDNYDH